MQITTFERIDLPENSSFVKSRTHAPMTREGRQKRCGIKVKYKPLQKMMVLPCRYVYCSVCEVWSAAGSLSRLGLVSLLFGMACRLLYFVLHFYFGVAMTKEHVYVFEVYKCRVCMYVCMKPEARVLVHCFGTIHIIKYK